ncbi:MAG TPA: sigma-70 region 4 domain-containing protein, partial [Terriglobia bacterium]|nr:sigma-70 region 4 domain-containing protein [Terriglobia bacterium]
IALERLMQLIHRLRPMDRQVMLRYLEDMDAESIGEITGISAGNVRVLIIVFVLFVHGVYERIGWGLVIAGLLYVLGYLVYENAQRMRDESINNCLRFYRRALERKRQHVRHTAVAAIMLVAGAIMVVLPGVVLILQYPVGNIWIKLAPFWIILALWGLAYYLMRRRIRDEFRREFATLERLEKDFGK